MRFKILMDKLKRLARGGDMACHPVFWLNIYVFSFFIIEKQ